MVFTLPHELKALVRLNQRLLYDLLLQEASRTLLGSAIVAWTPRLGSRPSFIPGIASCDSIPTPIVSSQRAVSRWTNLSGYPQAAATCFP